MTLTFDENMEITKLINKAGYMNSKYERYIYLKERKKYLNEQVSLFWGTNNQHKKQHLQINILELSSLKSLSLGVIKIRLLNISNHILRIKNQDIFTFTMNFWPLF